MRLFYSHSFSVPLAAKVRAFRGLLEAAVDELALEMQGKGAPGMLRFDIIEGDKAEFGDPASALFPRIGRCDVFFSLLLDEAAAVPGLSHVSPSCLQELIVAHQASKPTLAWVEKGCSSCLGFGSSLTTYREFTVDDLLFDEGRQAIRDNIKQRLVEAFLASEHQTTQYLYCNTFSESSPDTVDSFLWRRGAWEHTDGGDEIWRSEQQPRSGGQRVLAFGGEAENGCLAIAATAMTWNWNDQQGKSITTLGTIDPSLLPPDQTLVVELRCRTSGTALLRPLLQGVITDPRSTRLKGAPAQSLIANSQESNWNWKSVGEHEGWTSKQFHAKIDLPPSHRIEGDAQFYLVVETGEDILFIDHVVLGVVESG
ncbi:hypothetical protein JW848_00010 [Candidatus Bipolaricaulota bacterium]|nr:hypothetical protein [Candidatus Bipolaricaulota bacterium]